MLYSIPNGSMYVSILRIRYVGGDYIKAHVMYFSRPGRTLLHEDKNCKIPTKCFSFWEKHKE